VEHNSLKHDKANSLLEALSKATQKILSLQTLRKIESTAETAAITAAAAIALGVMGSEIVIRELLALSDEVLKGISGRKSRDEDQASRELEQAVRELEAACADRGIETIGQPTGLVADIPGTIRDDKTGVPLAGVAVDGGPLGITHTNANGEFIFRNVTIDQGFVIIAKNGTHSFFPSPAVGTVSATTYLTILATPRSTDKARHT
jgi:hypothetical protein